MVKPTNKIIEISIEKHLDHKRQVKRQHLNKRNVSFEKKISLIDVI
jgi:hypothetical protein